jgi:hypothetical protein
MLFHHVSEPGSGVDIEQIEARLHEEVDPALLRRAWERTAAAHEPLRTRFEWEGRDEPVQQVLPDCSLPFVEEDWRGSTPEAQEERLRVLR